jgi:hypothetical protein
MPNVIPLRPGDPRRVGRYRLTGRVADVAGDHEPDTFLAQRADGETVMATLLGADRAGDAAARDRFVAEARVARNIPPFCVARILDAGIEGGRPYLITEFIPGPSLAEVVASDGMLSGEAVKALAIGSATGIGSIHQAGLVHGQFGPDMVVLGRDGPRVVHFSTTPPYGAATPAADILAWAHTMVFATAGRRAAAAEDLTALPPELRAVVADCLSADPMARPHARALLTELLSGSNLSAGLLAEGSRLSRAAARLPLATAVPGNGAPPRRDRSRAVLWAAACVACVLAIVAAVVFIAGQHPRHGTPPASSRADAAAPLAVPGALIPARYDGTWTGTITQKNPSISVAVRVSLAGRTGHGTLAYPQIGCTGRLGLTAIRGGLMTFRLAITTGKNNCVGGKLTLAGRAGGGLAFTFLRPGGGNPVGTLSRQR